MPVQKNNNKNIKGNNPTKPNKPSRRTNNQSSAINKKSQKSNDSSIKKKPVYNPPENSGNQQKPTVYSQVDNALQKGSKFLDKANNTIQKFDRTTNRIIELFEGGTNRKPESLQPFKVVTKLATATNERLVKAQLRPEDNPNQAIEFMFNPTDLQFNRSVEIKEQEGVKTQKGLPKVNFAFVQAWTLKLSNLLFDTYEQRTDVIEEIQPILDTVDFTKFSGNQTVKRPPVYYFTWGERDYLRCMVNSISYKLTMFLPDGTPVRALVNLDLKEVDDSPTFKTPDPKAAQSEESKAGSNLFGGIMGMGFNYMKNTINKIKNQEQSSPKNSTNSKSNLPNKKSLSGSTTSTRGKKRPGSTTSTGGKKRPGSATLTGGKKRLGSTTSARKSSSIKKGKKK
ncbi:hypothetical protein NIES2119_05700 [[Phormidium ambiguum] IAM M-71]|uniref:Contractile injection system tube protein N-terminal domain-containing protein n=1 Tax=[Phormidium ambiguum] IAM M-71 TaxID=454136 RepID=A0A1U7IQP6_9CYAN|nr:hypothetical protein [Phormidium ambiguum]OKH39740.1 hypothetical protein NIES2119_05700 [Phormidium ambiguum IAM M-71]